jgi:hypothetical protein
MLDLEALGDGLADLVLDAVERTTAPLIARIAVLEGERAASAAKWGERLDALQAKTDEAAARATASAEALQARLEATSANIQTAVQTVREIGEEARKEFEALPPDLSREDVEEMIASAIEALLVAEPGAKGDPGADAPAVTDAQIEAAVLRVLEPHEGGLDLIAQQVSRYMEANPAPKGDPGEPGAKGDPGKDGVGLAGALIDRSGNLIITMSDGTARDLGPVEGKDGKAGADGQPGAPGFSLEDFDSEVRDGGRTLVLSFTAGDTKHTVEHQLDTMIYRGAYKADHEYQPGDTVTYGGQTHHCNAQTTDRPDSGSGAWTLCSRRGRDGKDADPAPLLRLIEDKVRETEDSLMKRIEAYLRSKGL